MMNDEQREKVEAVLYPTGDTEAIKGRVLPVVQDLMAQAWDEGYESAKAEAARQNHSGNVQYRDLNPYGDD